MDSVNDTLPGRVPFTVKYMLELSPPTESDTSADLERLLRGLEMHGLDGVRVPLRLISGMTRTLRESDFLVAATIGYYPYPTLIRLEPANSASRNLGLAIDLGSTNMAGTLLDLDTEEELGSVSILNPQVEHGDDILTRTHFCIRPGMLEELQSMAAAGINGIAAELADGAGVGPDDITGVSVAGNTTMAHLLLGLDPYHICRAPYVPVANRFPVVRATELGLNVCPEAPVYVLPNVGSYVGGDALAGVLVSGMHRRDGLSLMVDIGTNAEIIVGNSEFLFAGAGSAGPGLEGAVVRDGMRATDGAIERVRIYCSTLQPEYDVIGGVKPLGLCGSGIIDLMAELFMAGIIDGRGRFVTPAVSDRVVEADGQSAYLLVPAGDSGSGRDIVMTERDIDNMLMSKAAMYTMLDVVAGSVGVPFGDLERFFIAGTFGEYISPKSAITIGMVPELEISRFVLLGNSSLKGAAMTLLSLDALREVEEIARMMTYMEMNESRDFMDRYMSAMFLPHTDAGLFPGVTRSLTDR